jgi:iron complex outermembrane receptor protein
LALAAASSSASAQSMPTTGPASIPETPPNSQTAASHPAPATQPSLAGAADLLAFEDIPIVVAASKHEQRASVAPAAVTVVTAEEIELYGYRSLADILRTQRGFYVASDGLNQFLGVRGFLRPGEWNARILVMVDGRPTREPIFGQTHLDQDFVVPVEMIKRVEIIRGPGSSLYGSNAVFAVINIITRDGADVKNWAELKAQGGNKETARGETIVGKKFDNGLDVIAGASRFSSEGDNDIKYFGLHGAGYDNGHMVDHDFEGAGSGFWKMSFQEFTFEADFMKRDKENRAATYLTLWQDPGSMMEQRDDFSLRWDHKVSEGQSLHVQTFFSQYAYDQFYGLDDGSGPYRYNTTANSDWFGEDVHYDWQINKQNRLVFGTEAMQTTYAKQLDYDSLNDPLVDVSNSFNWWALYAQDEYSPCDWLTLVGGLRMDKLQRFDPLLDPRFAAIFTPNKADTFKLLYGQAFRAPNLYEMFYWSPGTNVGNPDLKPEINTTYEALWGHDYQSGWHSEAGYYYWITKNALGGVTTDDGSQQVQNVGTIWAQGVEGEVSRKWSNGARVRVSGSLGRATDENSDREEHSPDMLLSLAGAVPVINGRTFLALETQMVGPQLSDTGASSNASFITNFVVTSKNVWKGVDLQVGIYNLFGDAARIPHTSSADQAEPWLRQPGLSVLFSLTYRF